jgi:alkanesulfonate monooxygenase SsuD/methylene tetrahydromethanopterin reductase-like flavin-dependent oxidoreductase (luciferase family)
MHLSTVILPLERWPLSREKWRRAEELGFYAAYIYDHLSWPHFRDQPWFASIPTLAAAAVETSTIRLGTLVTTPNFRHPVPLAKDLLSVDDISAGRLTIGIGAGVHDNDATVLGGDAWSARERMDRFVNFVDLLDELLREDITTHPGSFYSANEARMLPGTVQQPRPPFCIAATGKRGMDVAARRGDAWVSIGRSAKPEESCFDAVTSQMARLDEALVAIDRPLGNIDRVLLDGLNSERPLVSVDAFVDWAGRYQALGITELVIHWPVPDSLFQADLRIFEKIATDGLAQL